MPRGRAAPLVLAGIALLSLVIGLSLGAWRTGQIDPLHWLWPALAAIVVMTGYLSRIRAKQTVSLVNIVAALLVAPPLLACLVAGSLFPLRHAMLLALVLLAVSLVAAGRGRHHRTNLQAGAIVLGGSTPALLARLEGSGPLPEGRTAVLAGVPLIGVDVGRALGRANGSPADRAPFWDALALRRTLMPIDSLEPSALSNARSLLLVQPRLLQPRELVLLDDWVRAGGDTLILADPFLLWPDERALGHPRRPPVTSLLDPLLTHWGLRLEPADMASDRPVLERRLLRDGTPLNLAGASRFTLVPGGTAHCRLEERGLIATCRVGRGRATLVADADFVEAQLWTLDLADPAHTAGWISGAVPLVDRRLGGKAAQNPEIPWIISEERVGMGLLLGILALGIMGAMLAALKMPSHILPQEV
jgi:hypothetical protein